MSELLEADANMARHNQTQQKHYQSLRTNKSRRESRYIQHEYQQHKRQRTIDCISASSSSNTNNNMIKVDKTTRQESGENLSFCGCGFLGIYHVGVASALTQYGPLLNQRVSGCSAGSLAAIAYICGDLLLAQAATNFIRVAIDARSRSLGPFHPSFDINAILTDILEKYLPEDVHLKVNGRLHVSLTRVFDGENVIVSKFDSKEDVIQAILCSCFIPFWSGIVAPKFKGLSYTDGGFTNNLLILDDKTITVSPFAGEADICPEDDTLNLLSFSFSNTSVSLTPHNLYRASHALMPPPTEFLNELCARGFADGIRFLQKMNFISLDTCVEIRSSLIVSEVLDDEIMEEETKEFLYLNNDDDGSCVNSKFNNNLRGLWQNITSYYGRDDKSRITKTTLERTTSSTGCFVNGLLASAAASGERIVIDIERALPLLIDSIPLYPFFYACAAAALVYLMECLRSKAKIGKENQRRMLKLVQYFSI